MQDYIIKKISAKTAKEYIHKHHYSRGSHNGPSPCYGLFDNANLIGVLMFATPCSENVRASIFGQEHKDTVVELHRLHILDCTPKNTESLFISRCIKLLKVDRPHTRAIISFADSTENHSGIIYRATNALFCGQTPKTLFFRDKDNRLRHPRQNGVNISSKKAKTYGWIPEWRDGKNRYVWVIAPSKVELKKWKNLFKLTVHNPTSHLIKK